MGDEPECGHQPAVLLLVAWRLSPVVLRTSESAKGPIFLLTPGGPLV